MKRLTKAEKVAALENELENISCALSPENLHWDGERAPRAAYEAEQRLLARRREILALLPVSVKRLPGKGPAGLVQYEVRRGSEYMGFVCRHGYRKGLLCPWMAHNIFGKLLAKFIEDDGKARAVALVASQGLAK